MNTLLKEKLKPWPNHWLQHVINSSELYFDDYKPLKIDIAQIVLRLVFNQPVQTNPNISILLKDHADEIVYDKTLLQIIYLVKDAFYIVDHSQVNSKNIKCIIYKIVDHLENISEMHQYFNNSFAVIPTGDGTFIGKPIGHFIAESGYDVASKSEEIIIKDYWDDDDIDEEPETDFDPTPLPSLDLSPVA